MHKNETSKALKKKIIIWCTARSLFHPFLICFHFTYGFSLLYHTWDFSQLCVSLLCPEHSPGGFLVSSVSFQTFEEPVRIKPLLLWDVSGRDGVAGKSGTLWKLLFSSPQAVAAPSPQSLPTPPCTLSSFFVGNTQPPQNSLNHGNTSGTLKAFFGT